MAIPITHSSRVEQPREVLGTDEQDGAALQERGAATAEEARRYLRAAWTLIPEVDSGFLHRAGQPHRQLPGEDAERVRRRIRQIGRLQLRLRRACAALLDDVAALHEMTSAADTVAANRSKAKRVVARSVR